MKVFEQGNKLSSQYLIIYAKPNGLTHSRLGLSVSKKIGNAVVRNRIKRRLRESTRKLLLDNQLAYDLVIVARKNSVHADFDILKKNLLRLFSGLAHEKYIDRCSKNL